VKVRVGETEIVGAVADETESMYVRSFGGMEISGRKREIIIKTCHNPSFFTIKPIWTDLG
jgi:hypothetical protein